MTHAGLSGALDPGMLDAADDKAAALLEELKEQSQASIEEIGTLRKALTVTVPAAVIGKQVDHNFEELQEEAIVPGFRKGRAPRQLIEKRFGPDVRKSLKTTIIAQAYLGVTERESLEVLGDPLFRVEIDGGQKLVDLNEALQHIEIPTDADMSYTCEIEVKPVFELPSLEEIPVKRPNIEISDEQVAEQLERQQKIRGRLEPLADGVSETDDVLIVDAELKVGDESVKTEQNLQLGVRAARLDGINLPELGEKLTGVKPGDSVALDCEIPDDYERADLRGKQGTFSFEIHELKRLKPVPVEELVASFGAESEAQLREFIKDDLEQEKDRLTQRAMTEQVRQYLLDQTQVDLPEQLSARQTDRAVIRQVIELRQQGIPDGDIHARIDELRTSAKDSVARDLRLSFILEKVADEIDVHVTDEEVNTEIARMARLYNKRFDRVRDDLQAQGLLGQLAEQIQQDKCVEHLLSKAKIEDVSSDD